MNKPPCTFQIPNKEDKTKKDDYSENEIYEIYIHTYNNSQEPRKDRLSVNNDPR